MRARAFRAKASVLSAWRHTNTASAGRGGSSGGTCRRICAVESSADIPDVLLGTVDDKEVALVCGIVPVSDFPLDF